MLRWSSLLMVVALVGCAGHSLLPDADRMQLERTLPGRTYYLRAAMFLGPFWSDRHKQLLSDVVPGEIPFLSGPDGSNLEPGEPTGVVPAGARVRVVKLEMPTGFAVTTRVPVSPRYNPWLILEVEGQPREPSKVIVLRRDLRSLDQVEQELDRSLSSEDLQPVLAALPDAVLRAVNEKRLLEGMSSDAVWMAWGYPERKTLAPSPAGRHEEWVWPGSHRKATILDGRLQSWSGEAPKLESPTPAKAEGT